LITCTLIDFSIAHFRIVRRLIESKLGLNPATSLLLAMIRSLSLNSAISSATSVTEYHDEFRIGSLDGLKVLSMLWIIYSQTHVLAGSWLQKSPLKFEQVKISKRMNYGIFFIDFLTL